MNVSFNTFATSNTQWNNDKQTKQAETTGAIANHAPVFKNRQTETTGTIANNNNPLYIRRNAETTGAIAMFGAMGGMQEHQGQFMAVA